VKIYIGNLSVETGQPQLRHAFESFGEVSRVTLAVGKKDGLRKGFGFVEMPYDSEAQAAIEGMHGCRLDGREIEVHEANPDTLRNSLNLGKG
jgi:RNA recognition motif-containing protein